MKYFAFFASLIFLISCNLEKEIEIDLPEYDRQPVVECYLEPGKPFRLLLTQSYSFFDPFGLDSSFLQKTLLQDAKVSIRYDGKTVVLPNSLSVDEDPFKIFNYTAREIVPGKPGTEYTLDIILPNGKNIGGRTVMLPLVPIDSVVIEFSKDRDTLARALTYFNDDRGQTNFYRRLLNYKSLDSIPEQDFIANDRILQTAKSAFGTGYELKQKDTIYNTLFHITEDYYDYIESYQLAVFGNLNPFAQPASIKSNVSGTGNPIGIFTCLVYDREMTVVRK
jgi:Domain of unknown function (DUF4249)